MRQCAISIQCLVFRASALLIPSLLLSITGLAQVRTGTYTTGMGIPLRYVIGHPISQGAKNLPVWIIQDGDGTVRDTFPEATYREMAELIAEAYGVVTVAPELTRQHFANNPRHYCELDFFHRVSDQHLLIDTVKGEPQVDPSRIYLIGFSAGSDIVSRAARARADIAGVVTVGGGILQLHDYLSLTGDSESVDKNMLNTCIPGQYQGRSGLFWKQLLYSGLQNAIAETKVPYLAVFGDQDTIIRWDLNRPYAEEMQRRQPLFEYQVIEGMGHGFGLNPSRWRIIQEWMNRQSRDSESPVCGGCH